MNHRTIWLMIALTMILLLSAACENNQDAPSPIVQTPPTAKTDSDIAQLSDTVGDPSIVRTSGQRSKEQLLASAEDYHAQTGIWFQGEGFNILSSISQGVVKAGQSVGAALSWLPEGCSVRFQLTRRDDDGSREALVAEYSADQQQMINNRIDFGHPLPDTPNTNYLLSIEILNKDGKVEDTLLSPLFVPPNELHARLSVLPTPLAQGSKKTTLKLYNAGPTHLFFGYGYEIYRMESSGWTLVPPDKTMEVPAIGISIPPGETFEEQVLIPADLEPGVYRIVKSFGGDQIDAAARLAASFEIF
ncbi:immunoglobulin-like domain-containing protein [Paenibacillus guangzhouensis]|uniref:immunoglobulin-like domain-containing protein n=1 Tax=Paenibacillus guangzhouensis TaxID=1473112 RepID=UPI00187B8CC9|nr:immunoglobulin-like domain-containing protein [Paenibacillus guangzhouensis]